MASKEKLMNGVNAMDRILNNSSISPQETPEKPKPKKPGKSSTKKPDKTKKKVFSFWADADKPDTWRTYAKVKNMSVSDLGVKAMDEYIKRHKLTEREQQIFDLYMDS